MSKLLDINNVIMPIDNRLKEELITNIDNILENLIMDNNMIFNTYIFNHIIYNNNDINFENKALNSCIKYLNDYLKKQKQFFRVNNKKNKFNLSNVNDFINTFYKLVIRINSMMIHLKVNNLPNSTTVSNSPLWGSSPIINCSFQNLCLILLNDNIIESALIKCILEHEMIERNDVMYRFIQYINILNNYDKSIRPKILSLIDTIMVKTIPLCDFDIDNKLLQIYKFKSSYYHYNNNINKYYYMKENKLGNTNDLFPKLILVISNNLDNIINMNDTIYLENFITIYRKILIEIYKNIDIYNLLVCKKIESFTSLISYYNKLYSLMIFKEDRSEYIIANSIEQKLTYYNSIENINILVEKINRCIVEEKDYPQFLYLAGSKMKNKDHFIKSLCHKFMYRIIYCNNLDMESFALELKNYDMIQMYFNVKDYYHYTVIFDDYKSSISFNIHNTISQVSTNNIHMKMVIATLNIWRINHGDSHISDIKKNGIFTNILCDTFNSYNKTLKERNQQIILYPHLGMIDCNIQLSTCSSNIVMTPLHMICLELFDNTTTFMHPYIFIFRHIKNNMKEINDRIIEQIIKSLVIGKVLLLVDNHINITKNIMHLNNNMPEYINLIEIFHNITDYEVTTKIKILNELAHDRSDIIMCNINSNIKKNNNRIHIDLCYTKCKEDIKIFEMNKILYNKAIDRMVIKDLIAVNDSYLEILF